MKTLSLFFLFAISNILFAQEESALIRKGAKPVLVSSNFSFTEGPAADANGNVFFTDQPNNRIYKWSEKEGVSVFMESAGRSNGLYFDHHGNLIACADEKNELWKIDRNGKVTVLITDYDGKKLNGPNDLWIDRNGGIYFTDPFYKREYWSRSEKEIAEEKVYYLSPERRQLVPVMSDFVRPNGIIGSPDGKTLYVADIGAGKTYSFDIAPDGRLTNRKLFTEMGSDGMTLDNKGNVYLTGKGVTVFNPNGKKIGHIPIDAPWTANVTFGGKDGKTLFVTASKSVYTLDMKVKGAGR